eukprot:7385653-Prymnesium_polylepis.2
MIIQRGHARSTRLPMCSAATPQSTSSHPWPHAALSGSSCKSTANTFHSEQKTAAICPQLASTTAVVISSSTWRV